MVKQQTDLPSAETYPPLGLHELATEFMQFRVDTIFALLLFFSDYKLFLIRAKMQQKGNGSPQIK
jgi:hypothetical protein